MPAMPNFKLQDTYNFDKWVSTVNLNIPEGVTMSAHLQYLQALQQQIKPPSEPQLKPIPLIE